MSNRDCCISGCDSTDSNAKLLLHVPRNSLMREKWFTAKLDPTQEQAWCCEDHFDLELDTKDWARAEQEGNGELPKPDVDPNFNAWSPQQTEPLGQISQSTRKRKNEIWDPLAPSSFIVREEAVPSYQGDGEDECSAEKTIKLESEVLQDSKDDTKSYLEEDDPLLLSDQINQTTIESSQVDERNIKSESSQDTHSDEFRTLIVVVRDSASGPTPPLFFTESAKPNINMVLLKNWTLMEHLDIEILSEISYFHAYPSKIENDLYLSALYTTWDGQVFGIGYNTKFIENGNFGTLIKIGNCPDEFIANSVKLPQFTELGLQKILIGGLFGAGLTTKNEVWAWGIRLDGFFESRHQLMTNQSYEQDAKCSACSNLQTITDGRKAGAHSCVVCTSETGKSFQLHRKPFRWIVQYDENAVLNCLNCGKRCISMTRYSVEMAYCDDCSLIRYAWDGSSLSPRKIELGDGVTVKDIACGRNFLVMLLEPNSLALCGWIGYTCYDRYIHNPDGIEITYLTCGYAHIAVISNKGELYTCGSGAAGQLGYRWNASLGCTTLRRVQGPSKVIKVCCGKTNTVCLTETGEIWCCGMGLSASESGVLFLNQTDQSILFKLTKLNTTLKFVDIASSHWTADYFSAKEEGSAILAWGCQGTNKSKELELVTGASECFEAFVDHAVTIDQQA